MKISKLFIYLFIWSTCVEAVKVQQQHDYAFFPANISVYFPCTQFSILVACSSNCLSCVANLHEQLATAHIFSEFII
jgi:hypothetical protein